ncbi:hypothetical protein [Caballeronia glebae]|uniref:hypothetical protein n=1 Tax=Caballeronia glebae TaxID=1777143 RepID=UPI0038BDBBAD
MLPIQSQRFRLYSSMTLPIERRALLTDSQAFENQRGFGEDKVTAVTVEHEGWQRCCRKPPSIQRNDASRQAKAASR